MPARLTKRRIVDQSADEASAPSKSEEIQWPALDKLTPGNLKRTVSTIMKEWERTITPPADECHDHIHQIAASGKAPAETTEQEQSISQMPLL